MTLLIAFSGGPDSVYLVHHLLKTVSPENLLLVYCNHGLRTEEELQQEKKTLYAFAAENHLKLIYRKLPIRLCAEKEGISLETAARKWRYRMLIHLAHLFKCDTLMTGHHLDDDCETFIQKLVRGAQTHLHGMLPEQSLSHPKGPIKLMRPLLHLSKSEILKELHKKNIPYSVDSTNTQLDIQRNLIRETILPKLRLLDPQFESHMRSSLTYLREQQAFVNQQIQPYLTQIGVKEQMVFLTKQGWWKDSSFVKSQVIFVFLETWRNQFEPEAYLQEAHVSAILSGQSQLSLPQGWTLHQDNHRLRIMKSASLPKY